MGLITKKLKTTDEDFKMRQEKAIQLIKDVEFISTPKIRFQFTEKQLRDEFAFEDIDKRYDKYDNVFFNGDFVIYPMEKIIWV